MLCMVILMAFTWIFETKKFLCVKKNHIASKTFISKYHLTRKERSNNEAKSY